MKIFITSDTHFNHLAMSEWRGFKSVTEMNEHIIEKWNKVVDCGDTVYHLGDVFIGNRENWETNIEPNLNGNIIYIRGNHDRNTLTLTKRMVITWNGNEIELTHKPSGASGDVSIILHGHIHRSGERSLPIEVTQIKPHIGKGAFGHIFYNCNLEFHKYKPKLLNEIIGECKGL